MLLIICFKKVYDRENSKISNNQIWFFWFSDSFACEKNFYRQTDRQTDQPTDWPTDIWPYRSDLPLLKNDGEYSCRLTCCHSHWARENFPLSSNQRPNWGDNTYTLRSCHYVHSYPLYSSDENVFLSDNISVKSFTKNIAWLISMAISLGAVAIIHLFGRVDSWYRNS